VIVVALLTVNVVAAVPPKVTEVAPVKPVPVIVTTVPPAVGPMFGVKLVNVGAGVGGVVGVGDVGIVVGMRVP
jgi:hypothetical protein